MNRRRFLKTCFSLFGWAIVASAPAIAEVEPNPLFSEGMVLQRGTTVPVWGTADDGEPVTVTIQGQTATTTADEDGRWQVALHNLKAGGPFTLTISSGDQNIAIDDVLVGEVWICSGQSNMAWPVSRSAGAEAAIAGSADPELRLLTVPRQGAEKPQSTADVAWQVADSESVPSFSAVGYYFGERLREELDIPIGLINTSYGGTPAEAWTAIEALKAEPKLSGLFEREPDKRSHRRPARLYNAMIAPLIPYAFQGVIWYQGEANAGRAYEYRTLFPTMIENWRDAWGQGDFPFLFVQLAPFMKIVEEPTESAWAELREAQLMTMQTVPNSAMAVITDVGEADDIHPRKKQPVGHRLAQAALAIAYDKDVCPSGPVFQDVTFKNGKAYLTFDDVCGGLVAKGDPLTGFTIAGKDKEFHNAEAEIVDDDTVVVSSDQVEQPVAVRFGWANYPVVNLWNEAGLPASPFRTDDWPGVTGPRNDGQ